MIIIMIHDDTNNNNDNDSENIIINHNQINKKTSESHPALRHPSSQPLALALSSASLTRATGRHQNAVSVLNKSLFNKKGRSCLGGMSATGGVEGEGEEEGWRERG